MRSRRSDPADAALCSSCGERIERCAVCGIHACSRPLCEPCFLEVSGVPPSLRRDFMANARKFQRE